jgi:hypothetical protein
LPFGIAGIERNGEARLIRSERGRKAALRKLHVADIVVRKLQVALPVVIAGIGIRQVVKNGEARLIGSQGGGQITLRHLHVADLAVRKC